MPLTSTYSERIGDNLFIMMQSIDILKHQSMNGGDGGVTWAYEVGNDAMVCPLIVEDLTTPGQMLIEVTKCSLIFESRNIDKLSTY